MIGGPAAPEDGEGRARTFPPHPEPAPSPTRPQAVVGSVIERMKAEAGQRGEYILISDMAVKFTETTATLAITFEEPFYANVPEPSA